MLEEASGLSTEQTIDTGLPLIGVAIKMEWFKEPERERGGDRMREGKKRAPPSEFTLVLSPVFVHCVRSSSVVTPINRPVHLHPDRDKCNDKTVPLQKWKPLDDTAITVG